ncbi:MAG: Fe-S cluster assembly protein HesB [Acidimicrobiaceae bacterium]|nr:Fe-S cluster assembly protein HesB [Acidimicrobiaceae bacterium]MBT5581984.1 Fe-S cluster assembly protein HesB [Acidimicrobiaceae bacterium]MBT5850055.1 Fe-S cluster assembly protein HesB [Acidimicrobiaceae bacterium]
MKSGTLWVTGNPVADIRINTDPLALLIGMLLDQQIPIEWAFMGPHRLAERLGVKVDHDLAPAMIATFDPDEFVALVATKPALHRFPASMAKRIQALCSHILDEYEGDAAAIWRSQRSATTIHDRLIAVPGYGDEKARIFIAVLAKRFGKRPSDWQLVSKPFGDELPRSVADMGDEASHAAVRAWRLEQKSKGKSKAD